MKLQLWFVFVFLMAISSEILAGSHEKDIQAIRALTQEFVSGFNTGDINLLMRFYGPRYIDVNLKNQSQTYEERRTYYAQILARKDTQVEVTPEEIVIDGTHATVRGTIQLFSLDAEGKRGEPKFLRYMELLERQPEGWKSLWGIDAEIYPENR